MRVTRRHLLAILASVGLHGAAVVAVVVSSVWGGWPRAPIDVEITGMRLEDLRDLPLGLPATGDQRPEADITPPPRRPPRQKAPGPDKTEPEAAETNPDGGAAPPRPSSVRSYAPEGSRVTALLRVDRLRDTVYAAAVDGLLMRLPDRRDLLEGTGVDLYRDIDALLIATPNPMDVTVTFLAARHRMTDGALRAALERGARATGRKLSWRTERGRPFAERRSVKDVSAPASADATSGTPAPVRPSSQRDQRLILLAAPKLVVVTPPAYRSLILRGPPTVAANGGAMVNAGAGGAGGSRAPQGGGDAGGDAGAGGGGIGGAADDGSGWALLLRRIDAEDSVMPLDAVAMVSAVDLFAARTLRPALDVVPGTRGAVDDGPAARPTGASGATIFGLPVPRLLTATLGVTPQPFADIDAEFSAEADAARWETEWPVLRRRLLTNPLVALSGFGGLIGRATLVRQGTTVRLHVDATELETTRILEIAAAQMTALGQ